MRSDVKAKAIDGDDGEDDIYRANSSLKSRKIILMN